MIVIPQSLFSFSRLAPFLRAPPLQSKRSRLRANLKISQNLPGKSPKYLPPLGWTLLQELPAAIAQATQPRQHKARLAVLLRRERKKKPVPKRPAKSGDGSVS